MPNNANNSMYARCVAVIKSCRHYHHFRTARKYVGLAMDSGAITVVDYLSLLRLLEIQRSEIFGGVGVRSFDMHYLDADLTPMVETVALTNQHIGGNAG